MLDDVH